MRNIRHFTLSAALIVLATGVLSAGTATAQPQPPMPPGLDTLAALSTHVAVLAEQRILAFGRVDEIVRVDHPFIRNFFLSERSARALKNTRLH